MERLLSVRELSALISWDPMTVYKKASSGEIPGRVKLGRRSIRFRETVIAAWLRERENPPGAALKS